MHNEDWLEEPNDGGAMTWRPSKRGDENNTSNNRSFGFHISSQQVSVDLLVLFLAYSKYSKQAVYRVPEIR